MASPELTPDPTFAVRARTLGIAAAWMAFIVVEVYAIVSGLAFASQGKACRERALSLDHGPTGRRDGAVPGALDGRSPRLCLTAAQDVCPRGSRLHDRLRGHHLLHQLHAPARE